jgi:hypothetical protein
MSTLREFYLSVTPPLWDNLAYQTEALDIFRAWLDGNFKLSIQTIDGSMVPAHVSSLALSYLIFGQAHSSPYIVSALFGLGTLVAIYLLSIELGASSKTALWGSLLWSVTPNFLYQNFLETRNDYQLGFFIALSWLFILRAIKESDSKKILWAGIFSGIGILFKASGVGYIAIGFAPIFFLPKKYSSLNLSGRIKLMIIFAGGVVLISAWHYIPHLKEIISYYGSWGRAGASWKASQYGLDMSYWDYFFYPKNAVFTHIGMIPAILFGITLFFFTVINLLFRKYPKDIEVKNKNLFLFLTAGAFLLPIIFISWQQSFSSAGDTPVIPLLVSLLIALFSKYAPRVNTANYILALVIGILLLVSLPNIPIVERQFSAKDFNKYYQELQSFRNDYDLQNLPMMGIYSHPIYNADSFRWQLLMNKQANNLAPDPMKDVTNILFPENPVTIAAKLEKVPLLVLSDFSGVKIGGEVFHTFNRLHDSINNEIEKSNKFIKIRKVELEDGIFPIYLALNRDYVRFALEQNTPDGWVKWGDSIKYYSSEPRHLIWRGTADGSISQFILVNRENAKDRITFSLNKKLNGGIGEYHSDLVPSSIKLKLYTLLPIQDKPQQSSIQAIGKPAFYGVDAKIINHQ